MLKGDYVKIHGLNDGSHLNGEYAEVVHPPKLMTVPTVAGPEEAVWCGCFVLGPKFFGTTGYFKPENIEVAATHSHEIRAVNIHLFGTEDAPR
jgi:hypothetical protein